MRKWLKTLLFVFIGITVVFASLVTFAGYSLTRANRMPIEANPGVVGLTYESISFKAYNSDLTLRGWYLPVEGSDRIIIMVHGYGYHRADPTIGMMDIASRLVKNGYSVLTFDMRGHGESDGDTVSAGSFEKNDLRSAVDYAKQRGYERIGVLGYSMGAVTALLEAAENSDIDAVVSDSAFADLNDIMQTKFCEYTRAPAIFLQPLLFLIKAIYKIDFYAITPVKEVNQICPRPVFFIHGEKDELVPATHAARLMQACDNPSDQVWIAPGSPHVHAYKDHPDEYIQKVTAYFNENL